MNSAEDNNIDYFMYCAYLKKTHNDKHNKHLQQLIILNQPTRVKNKISILTARYFCNDLF